MKTSEIPPRTLSMTERERQRTLRAQRQAEAERLKVGMGWIGPDLKPLIANPPKLNTEKG